MNSVGRHGGVVPPPRTLHYCDGYLCTGYSPVPDVIIRRDTRSGANRRGCVSRSMPLPTRKKADKARFYASVCFHWALPAHLLSLRRTTQFLLTTIHQNAFIMYMHKRKDGAGGCVFLAPSNRPRRFHDGLVSVVWIGSIPYQAKRLD